MPAGTTPASLTRHEESWSAPSSATPKHTTYPHETARLARVRVEFYCLARYLICGSHLVTFPEYRLTASALASLSYTPTIPGFSQTLLWFRIAICILSPPLPLPRPDSEPIVRARSNGRERALRRSQARARAYRAAGVKSLTRKTTLYLVGQLWFAPLRSVNEKRGE